MNHSEARQLIGADPHSGPPELAEHLTDCPECSRFQREMVELDNDIRRALEEAPPSVTAVPQIANGTALPENPAVPAVVSLTEVRARARGTASAVTEYPRRNSAWLGWAVAASTTLLAIAAVWAVHPGDSLAHEVVQHVQLEPDSWTVWEHVTPEEINASLAHAGVELDVSSDKVMYVRTCPFRGHVVPHLVVNTPEGRVTVLILRYQSVKRPTEFHEGGLSGVITPAPQGSVAVLMQNYSDVEAVAREVQHSVHWLSPSGS